MSETDVAPKGRGKAQRILLVVSLGINLAVAGLAVGAWWHGPGPRDGRDLGFGFMDEVFRPADRAALRQSLRAHAGDLRSARAEIAADLGVVVTALRADPFDPAALKAALVAQQDHLSNRMRIGSEVIGDYLAALSPEDRADFADRLESRMRRGKDAPKED